MAPPKASTAAPELDFLAIQELHETTRDICSRLDLDQTLQAIVSRANRMLGGDVAYLATCDDTNQVLRMRASDRVRTKAFRSLVIPYDIGLGGAVAAQRRALTISDYLDDTTLTHETGVDASALGEGLRSCVAAPVEFESRLLAVLFVSKREPYSFSHHQVTTLSSLANAAAIALNNAQTYSRLVAAMSIHETLVQLALSEGGTEAITDALAELTHGPVELRDWRGTTVARAGGEFLPDHSAGNAIVEDDSVVRREIKVGSALEGVLYARPSNPDLELATVAIDQATTVLALELTKIRAAENTEMRLRGGVVSELISSTVTDNDRLIRHAQQLGHNLLEPHAVALVRFLDPRATGRTAAIAWQRLGQYLTSMSRNDMGQDLLVADRGDVFVALIPGVSDTEVHQHAGRIAELARRGGLPEILIGVGSSTAALDDFPRSFVEASRAIDIATSLGKLGPVVAYNNLGFHQQVLGAQPNSEIIAAARVELEPLLSHDARRNGELTQTLFTYLEASGNAELAARTLNLHPNSMRARLVRITELLGRDVSDARCRLDLHLALIAIKLSK